MMRQILAPALRTYMKRPTAVPGAVSTLARYHDSSYRPPTMDDLPVPSGSWEAQYKSNQTKYNMHLAIGILFFTVTLITAKTSGLIYFNFSPPKLPKSE